MAGATTGGLATAPGWTEFFDRVERISHRVSADAFSLGIVQQGRVHTYNVGFDERISSVYATFSVTAALPGPQAYRSRIPEFFRNAQEAHSRYPLTAGVDAGSSYDAAACLPLLLPVDAPLGYLALHYYGPRDFQPGEREELGLAASEVASRLHRVVVNAQDAFTQRLQEMPPDVLRGRVLGLTRAMESRAGIEQAKGVLMERYGIDADQAWSVLQRWASEREQKVREVALDVLHGTVRENRHEQEAHDRDGSST